jgi:hypothetical protein
MKSKLFYTNAYQMVQKNIKTFLNEQNVTLNKNAAKSTRGVGDTIQDILSENFQTVANAIVCTNCSANFARRAMADLAFEDKDGCYYIVDVKTHMISTKFNMPNLTSVERIARFYEDDKNYFVILMVTYDIEKLVVVVKSVDFIPIEFLDWECLTIGALGWGQIQIANSNRIKIKKKPSRKQWMLQLCWELFEFYPKEIQKIDKRLQHFKKVENFWKQRSE